MPCGNEDPSNPQLFIWELKVKDHESDHETIQFRTNASLEFLREVGLGVEDCGQLTGTLRPMPLEDDDISRDYDNDDDDVPGDYDVE